MRTLLPADSDDANDANDVVAVPSEIFGISRIHCVRNSGGALIRRRHLRGVEAAATIWTHRCRRESELRAAESNVSDVDFFVHSLDRVENHLATHIHGIMMQRDGRRMRRYIVYSCMYTIEDAISQGNRTAEMCSERSQLVTDVFNYAQRTFF